MAWRVDGQHDRWVACDDQGVVTADPDTVVESLAFEGRPVQIVHAGPVYTPVGDGDQVWWFLLAHELLPGPARSSGTTPTVPSVRTDPGVVY